MSANGGGDLSATKIGLLMSANGGGDLSATKIGLLLRRKRCSET